MRYKRVKIAPIAVLSYLLDCHKFYKEECAVESDWKNCDALYQELLKAYHVYAGIKKDYRKEFKTVR